MKREWQPGDVVHHDGVRAFRSTDRSDDEVCWIAEDGYWLNSELDDIHPLAVIDPEAAIPDEWLGVFYSAWMAADFGDEDEDHRAALAALFAHIAAPPEPKPEEPTGDRATVRDRDGKTWTRFEEVNYDPQPWRNIDSGWRNWSDLDVPADGVLWGGVDS